MNNGGVTLISLKFPSDSKDLIEILFASTILRNFPYYADFWEEFIGYDKATKDLRPYALKFPEGMNKTTQELITKNHEQIAIHHYSIFCGLSGAHFQLERATDALKEADNGKRHFLFWEAFGNFYMHIGNTRYYLMKLWEETRKLLCLPKSSLGNLLSTKPELKKQHEDIKNVALQIRNNLVHYARNSYVIIKGKYWIPFPPPKKPKNNLMRGITMFKEATKQMESDLKDMELFLNNTMLLIRNKIHMYFTQKKIEIVG